MKTEPRKTKRGTPLSPQWDDEWIAQVEAAEEEHDKRICGAHSPAWNPCTLVSTHPNGRCRYHGGAVGIGAPQGNRNAMVHGLYSQRLQQCGDHCPKWQTCPLPARDVTQLAPEDRPICLYEQAEYDLLTSSFQTEKQETEKKSERKGEAALNSFEVLIEKDYEKALAAYHGTSSMPEKSLGHILVHHNITTFQIMFTRAQRALSVERYTQETRSEGKDYSSRSTKVSALLQAMKWIAGEHRHWLRLLASDTVCTALGIARTGPTGDPPKRRSLPDIMKPILEKTEDILEDALKEEAREREARKRSKPQKPRIDGLDPEFAT